MRTRRTQSLVSLAVAGVAGFGTALGVHPMIGYIDWFHLAPAVLGAIALACGWWRIGAVQVPIE